MAYAKVLQATSLGWSSKQIGNNLGWNLIIEQLKVHVNNRIQALI